MNFSWHRCCVAGAILTTPFIGSVGGVGLFGNLGRQGAFLPLLAGVMVYLYTVCRKGRICVPQSLSYCLLIVFLCVVFVSGIVNIADIYGLRYQDRTGVHSFVVQTGAFCLYVFMSVYVYNFCGRVASNLDALFTFFRRWLYVSFGIAGVYSLVELSRMMDVAVAAEVLSLMDFFRWGEVAVSSYYRLRSVAGEASYLGMYLGLVFPWIFSSFFEVRGWKRILSILACSLLLIMAFGTMSRTCYVMVAVEWIIWLILFRGLVFRYRYAMLLVGSMILLVGSVICDHLLSLDSFSNLDFLGIYESLISDDGIHTVSNVSRYGSQVAALNLWLDKPILGAGFGMFGFYASDYYPDWAWLNPEIQILGNGSAVDPVWPMAHGIYSRILAELGAIGLVVWCSYSVCLYLEIRKCMKLTDKLSEQIALKNMAVSLLAVFMCGFNVDSFAVLFMWILYGIMWHSCRVVSGRQVGF